MRFFSALALSLIGSVVASPGASPSSVSTAVDPGVTFRVNKVVTTPSNLPDLDVVFLIDTTGSMSLTFPGVKSNLLNVISVILTSHATARMAVATFGDINDSVPFQVKQGWTNDINLLSTAVNGVSPSGGGDTPEDFISALDKLATGAVTWRPNSARVVVLISDAPSHDPSGGRTLNQAIIDLNTQRNRVIAVNAGDIDSIGQASRLTSATGGVVIGFSGDAITAAILKVPITVTSSIISCDAGLTVNFSPAVARVTVGSAAAFAESVEVASSATPGSTLRCNIRFLLDGKSGGNAFNQAIVVTVNRIGSCFRCDPSPGRNLCHPSTACAATPFGTMCLTRPGFKADGAGDGDTNLQWRLNWPVPGQEHRVAVKPGTSSNTLCNPSNTGPNVCKEVKVVDCSHSVFEDTQYGNDQKVIVEEDCMGRKMQKPTRIGVQW
ncbi:hypothetical protein TWF694_005988 [Orbilia ellipsospora]|uniref:VWFA domain-containing protein n=1 Tax=Orbilia ellipsospora TaxID=2528407 RepID=A0AAV9WSA1_9PEZI